jgi:cytochrome c-type biogenesis protein CcmF
LPAAYKFAVLWSGQEGSLLFWSLLLAGYGFVLRLRYKTDQRLFAYASVVIASVQVFFLLILNFAAHPFGLMQGALPADGTGLNPLLQYPEMVIHPPMLYLGYVGFTVPFAFALGALIMKYPGEKWIQITRRWTMVTWCFLTIGVFLGAHWAYAVLGWGGYWGWDPVENASLMPWLTGTAFLHSVMMQEKRGMLKVWNMCAHLRHVPALHARDLPHALGRDQFGARFRAVLDRHLVPGLHRIDPRGLHLLS